MTSNKVFEKLTFYLSAKDAPEKVWEYARQIEKDLEVLEILKKFFNFDAYYAKNLNSDFLEIIAKEDEEANIDRKAISFIDSDSRKLLEEWLKNDK